MALHESIEDQPPHKKSRAPAILDSFEQAFAPSSLSGDGRTSISDGTCINVAESSVPSSICQVPTPSPGHLSMELKTAGRPPSTNIHSASSSVSGLLSPFDRCTASDDSPGNNFQHDMCNAGAEFELYQRHQHSSSPIQVSPLPRSPRLNGTISCGSPVMGNVKSPMPDGLMSAGIGSPRGRPLSASLIQRTSSMSPGAHVLQNGISAQQYRPVQAAAGPTMRLSCSPVNRVQHMPAAAGQQLSPSHGNFRYLQTATNQTPNNVLQSSDAPRVRLLTAQMVLLLHAHKCSHRDKVLAQNSADGRHMSTCQVQQCAAMKSILNHALNCQRGDLCEVQHCVSSRKLIQHWKHCVLMECPICSPIKIAANQHCRSCKEWQKRICPEVRSHLVNKIVLCIFPNQDENYQRDKRMQSLVNYARKIEAEMFDLANNQDHYFYLLAEKIYKIRREIEDRRNEHKGTAITLQAVKSAVKESESTASLHQLSCRMPYNPDKMAGEKGPPNRIAPSAVERGQQEYASRYECSPCDAGMSAEQPPQLLSVKTEVKDAPSAPRDAVSNGDVTMQEVGEPETKQEEDVKPTEVKAETVEFATSERHRREARDKISSQVLHDILMSDDSIPFRQPVDPVLLNIPDYFDIIKKPMDLSTIKGKLDALQYATPWEFIEDVWLMFQNAWTYNKKTSKIYKMCSRLSEMFVPLMNAAMVSLGYCCGERYVFLPQVLFCYGNQLCCQIPRDAQYFCFTNPSPRPNLTNDKYTFCSKCFENIKDDVVLVGDDPNLKQTEVAKSEFQAMRNDNQEAEPFVTCKKCQRQWHQICALHHDSIYPDGFICPNCRKENNLSCRTNRFTAARLSNNKLGQWIENRVNNLLTKSGYSSLVGKVHIRVLASFDKICEVKPRMRQYFAGKLPDKYPFRSKAIFAFEEIEDRDVAFFGMHVQEYDAKAPSPNSRRVYISYLDSVYFFQPKQLRTDIYHEILIGYLDWVKRLGYHWGHIWACPPSEGDDYIFYCHPPDQKVPKQKRLIDWYRKMLDRAILDRVVLEYHDIMRDAVENDMQTVLQVPYFDGDFWPNVFEDSIKELLEEEERMKEEEEVVKEASSVSTSHTADSGEDEPMQIASASKRCSTQKKKNSAVKSKAQRKHQSKKISTGCDLTSKVLATMDKHKEVFFVIRLSDAPSNSANNDDIVDCDPILPSDLMDGRDAFLNFARERHYEFSTLRRAKYSTMAFLYEIHNQGADRFIYSCNKCKAHVEVRYHCTVCEDFDLCTNCYNKYSHEHRMERLAATIDLSVAAAKLGKSDAAGDQPQLSPQQSRQQSIERCIESLLHAVNCRNANCVSHPGCQKMKLVIQHIKQCTNKATNQCQICRQINMLCHHHARVCTDPNCLFPFCTGLKQKMQKQRALNTQLERRRMMTTMQRNMQPVMASPQQSVVRDSAYHAAKPSVARPTMGKPMRTPERPYILQRSMQLPVAGKQMRRCVMTANDMLHHSRMEYIIPTGVPRPAVQGMYPMIDEQRRLMPTQPGTMYHSNGGSLMPDAMWQASRTVDPQQQQMLLLRQRQMAAEQRMYLPTGEAGSLMVDPSQQVIDMKDHRLMMRGKPQSGQPNNDIG